MCESHSSGLVPNRHHLLLGRRSKQILSLLEAFNDVSGFLSSLFRNNQWGTYSES